MNLKSLAKDTAIYGLSSIVGRFLNYLLVPVYTRVIMAESGGYGIVTNLYAYTALLLALLTFGMETTLFAVLFFALVMLFLQPIAGAMGYAEHPEYIGCMAAIVALDAFQAIMFSRLRQQKRPVKFMMLKFAFIIPNILLNLFIFLVLPKMGAAHPELMEIFVKYNYGVGLVFFANLLCTGLVTFGFVKEMKGITYGFNGSLAKRLLTYSWPLLILSLVGVFNQVADKILYPLVDKSPEGMVQLGIYGACVKIAMIMALLTQAFRYAYEPIVFSGSRDKNSPETLADGMKYFVIFTLLAFLAVVIYLPLIQLIIGGDYRAGMAVVPIVMMALSDQTLWGAVMSAIGALVMVAVNILGIPRWGYMACAWGGFAGYATAMLLSYFIGQKKYPIKYDMRMILGFFAFAMIIFAGYTALGRTELGQWPMMAIGTVLLLAYCVAVWKYVIRAR